MNILNLDSVQGFIKTDAGDQPTVQLSVVDVTKKDGNTVVTVNSAKTSDLDFRIRLEGSVKVSAGDALEVTIADNTVSVLKGKGASDAARSKPSSVGRGCASYGDLI